MALNLPFGIYVAGNDPLDLRTVVDDIPARDALIAANLTYEGMKIYVKSEKKTYTLTGATVNDFEEQPNQALFQRDAGQGTLTPSTPTDKLIVQPLEATTVTVSGTLTANKVDLNGTTEDLPIVLKNNTAIHAEWGPIFPNAAGTTLPGNANTVDQGIVIDGTAKEMYFKASGSWRQVQSTNFTSGLIYKENVKTYNGDPFNFLNIFTVKEYDYRPASFTPGIKGVVGLIADDVANTYEIMAVKDANNVPTSIDWNWIHGYYIKAHQVTKQTTDQQTQDIVTLNSEVLTLTGQVTGLDTRTTDLEEFVSNKYFVENTASQANATNTFQVALTFDQAVPSGNYIIQAYFEIQANSAKRMQVELRNDTTVVAFIEEQRKTDAGWAGRSPMAKVTHSMGNLIVDIRFKLDGPVGGDSMSIRNTRLFIHRI